ncbi:hypothetical protein GCM10011519_15120 [Marmoricola endophyticus]|uniref:Endonuclease/exonuclease/phosphatase domain-containing protein n=1 Tax=Marmoricola endophyticus TaxID=2040280 RepID=A0A917BGQ7_9ACTN|nr:hypothetical protein GCM10011519_15120 [Marmoricola endophyticus]
MLALVVGVVLVVLVGSFALVWRDAGSSKASLTDGRPDRPQPSATATPSATPTGPTKAERVALDQALDGRKDALAKLAGKAQAQTRKRAAQASAQASARASARASATAAPRATFVFAEFNVQGASHRGNVPQRSRNALTLLNRSGATVAALQEFAGANRRAFFGAANGRWSEASLGVKSYEADNAILWRSDTWTLVKGETRTYPYFGGAQRRMPRVLLQNKQTGAQVWFASYHNAASCCGHANSAKWRRVAVGKQVADANALRAATKQPLIVAGDMNDRREYFCDMGPRAAMHSADGSTASGGCRVAPRPWIDWVMGTSDVSFTDYVRENSGFVRASSDHPFLTTTVTVGG